MEPQSPNFNQLPASSEKQEAYPLSSFEEGDVLKESAHEQTQELFKDSESHEKPKEPSQAASSALPAIKNDDSSLAIPISPQSPAISDDANDDDVIEKVWVARSKEIIKSTKGDPYQRGQKVSELQAEYINKRYGKEIKLPEGA